MEGYRLFAAPGATTRRRAADFARQARTDYSQAMVVALGFYLFGHLADLATTLGFLRLGLPEANLLPAIVLQNTGIAGLVVLKLVGAIATAWVFWRLRRRLFTVIFACAMAVLLIFVASVNSLDVLQALAQGTL